jgi:class 3 adenylate cyclase/FixJ family two-component response regulator
MTNAKPTILIVDDEPFNVDFLEQELDDLGYATLSAYNGQEALEQIAADPPDVILLDIMMPVLDGFQVLERLKAGHETRDIPVIVVSAMGDLASMVRGIQLGALDYLAKPVENALLRARLDTALLAKRMRDQELDYLAQVDRVMSAASSVEAGHFDAHSLDGVASREDKLGQLARVFQRMAREVALREQRLRRQLQEARLDVEEMKRALSEPVSIYLPMDRRQALAQDRELPETTSGAALFADISGFTPLTATLEAALGRQRGAEELTRQLEQVYSALIAEVHNYGGSVIGFSGDAITCWLDSDDGSRGVACALALQRAVQDAAVVLTAPEAQPGIAIKVTVAAGTARRFLVGSPDIQRVEVIAGRPLEEVALAEHHAAPGEVLIPAGLAEQLAGTVSTHGWREDPQSGMVLAVVAGLLAEVAPRPWPDLPEMALDEARCRPWLYPSIYELVRSSRKAFLAELRPATAFFLRFKGIDFEGDPQAGDRLDQFICRVQTAILRHEGTFIQLTIGDKGSYLSAVFGAPAAHPDDPARAVRAALELSQLPTELDFIEQVQIGIASGPMRTGAYGSPAQRTYGLMGDKVNLAARLMEAAAPTGILSDETVAWAVQGEITMEALAPIQVKGKREPVAVYHPQGEGRRPAARRRVPLIGRGAEWDLLQRSLADLQNGRSGALLVHGEAGMGKTRLLEELGELAATRQIQVYTQWTKAGPQAGATWLEPDLAAGQAAVLLLDDAQELDGRAWEAALALLERGAQPGQLSASAPTGALLIAIAARPIAMPWPEAYLNLNLHPAAQAMDLQGLSDEQAMRLACERLGVASLPEPVAGLLAGASGNPLFVIEMVDSLADRGALVVQGEEARLAPGTDLDSFRLTGSIQGLVASLLDRLSPAENLLLKVASVIGPSFSHDQLQAIYPVAADKETLSDLLQSLEWLELITQVEAGQVYRFTHPVTRELAYGSMLFSQRRQLHRQVAEWQEKRLGEQPFPDLVRLAEHWLNAGEPMKALDYLEQAGKAALERGDYAEAERLFNRCLELEARAATLEDRD